MKRFLVHPKSTFYWQALRSPKEAAAFEKHLEVSPHPEYEQIEEQLAHFQYVGNIFRQGGGF